MKKPCIRVLAALLCAAAVFSLFPVPAAAASGYSTVSNKGTTLQYATEDAEFVPQRAVVAGYKGYSIPILPRPSAKKGFLGRVESATPVTILGEKSGYYFFMTDDGRMGWNEKKRFQLSGDAVTSPAMPIAGDSGLTGEGLSLLIDFLAEYNGGAASSQFYTKKPVLILERGVTKKLTIYGKYKGTYSFEKLNASSLSVEWTKNVKNGSGTVEINTGYFEETEILEFSNSSSGKSFYVLIIVL